MDPRLGLLREFYRDLPKDRLKVETWRFGFGYLEELLAGGGRLEYGELTATGSLHKYKLAGVPEPRFEALLAQHVAKDCNVCLYFGAERSALFCLNLDNNHRENSTAPIPEVETAVGSLTALLGELKCPPLAVASGRGYHVWCRLEAPVPNEALRTFMLRLAVRAAAEIHRTGGDRRRIKFNFYPDPRADNVVSLRLFGSEHMKTRRFSQVLAEGRLLGEEESWARFEEHLRSRTVSAAGFSRAQADLEAWFHSEAAGRTFV